MRKWRFIKSAAAAVLSFAMLAPLPTMLPENNVNAASICSINTNKTYQMIQGFGGINLREWTGYDLTSEQVQRTFGNGDGELGFTILRVYVNDNSSQWNLAIPVAKQAQKLGATVFATPWSPPAAIRQNGSGGPRGGKYVLKQGSEAAYAKHLNDFIKYCGSQGVSLYSISVQNEPDWSEDWTYWSPDRAANFIAQYGKSVTEGTNCKLMSPESFSYSKDYYNAILGNQKAFENCDLFGTHFYGTQRNQMDFPALESCGKDIWMTEVYVPDSTSDADTYPQAVKVAENIHNGLVVSNLNAYVWWYIRRNYGPMKENGNISKRGYCMAQYSKYVRPGDIRIDATEMPNDDILVSAYKHSPTQIEIVAVNKGNNSISQQFSVDNRTITNVDRYRTSANENLAPTKDMEHDTSTYWAQLPANSVTTFIVSLESDGVAVPTNPNQPVVMEPEQPDENGYYFHDTFENGTCSWDGRGSAGVNLSSDQAYAGSKALLVTDREKAWNGTQKTLNYMTFEAGKEYSFSVCAYSETEQNLMLSMEYKDANGDANYVHIAQGMTSGGYVQLANTNFKIPEGASSPILYVESESGTDSFYIDEAIGAVAGTVIDGPKEIKVLRGDVNNDGAINAIDLT
ncbi:MAG TPA: glucuronoarabinoxylan endo-1,4-beta-xylanase, partial [Ruminococcus sp.]|nr:glucuronoarabinoxylan endo-1,4-beta-xylanase [Ruminococcus sp.]